MFCDWTISLRVARGCFYIICQNTDINYPSFCESMDLELIVDSWPQAILILVPTLSGQEYEGPTESIVFLE